MHAKYYMKTKNYCSKTRYSEISFLIQKHTTDKCSVSNYRQAHGRMLCLKTNLLAINELILVFENFMKVNNLLIYNYDPNPFHYLLWGSCCSLKCIRKFWLEAKSQFNIRLSMFYFLNVTVNQAFCLRPS